MALKVNSISELTNEQFWQFAAQIDNTTPYGPTGDCWRWIGSKSSTGYGRFRPNRRTMIKAHRMSYVLLNGNFTAKKPLACHSCDVRDCCNPAHIFPGTFSDNSRDASNKGRMNNGDLHGLRKHPERAARGASHGIAKMNDDMVREFRERFNNGESANAMARENGLSATTILSALHGITWSHITEPPIIRRMEPATPKRPLTIEIVREFKEALAKGEPCTTAAERLGIRLVTARNIKHGKSWKSVQPSFSILRKP